MTGCDGVKDRQTNLTFIKIVMRRRKRAVFGIETDIKKPRVAVEKKRKVNGRKKALYSVNEHIRCGRKAAKSCRKSIKANRKIAVIDG